MTQRADYKTAVAYWSSQPSTVDGMLGGYGTGRVPRLDVQHSSLFLRQMIAAGQLRASKTFREAERPKRRKLSSSQQDQNTALENDKGLTNGEQDNIGDNEVLTVDCGAGIGRVTRDLLVQFSDCIDIVEPCEPFTESIRTSPELSDARRLIRHVWTIGVQDFEPVAYTIIWNQWCLGQLDDEALIAYLTRCKAALKDDKSAVFVKENVASGKDVFDEQDSSWTRTEDHFREIFKAAGLKIVKSSWQHGFPKELFQVKLWALK